LANKKLLMEARLIDKFASSNVFGCGLLSDKSI
jgi:hypothetical protein